MQEAVCCTMPFLWHKHIAAHVLAVRLDAAVTVDELAVR